MTHSQPHTKCLDKREALQSLAQVRFHSDLPDKELLLSMAASLGGILTLIGLFAQLLSPSDHEASKGFAGVGTWLVPIVMVLVAAVTISEWFASGPLMLLLVAGYIIWGNEFAKVMVISKPIPLYLGEAVLVVSFAILLIRKSLGLVQWRIVLPDYQRMVSWLCALYVVGAVQACRGISSDLTETLRDVSMFYYSIFLLYVPLIVVKESLVKRALWTILIAIALLSLLRSVMGTAEVPILGNQVAVARDLYLAAGIIFGICVLNVVNLGYRLLILIFMALSFYWVIMEQTRAVWVGLVCGLGVACWKLWRYKAVSPNAALQSILILCAVCLIVIVGMSIMDPEAFRNVLDEVNSMVEYGSDSGLSADNARMRIEMWTDVLNAFPEFALTGIGFGTPFVLPSLVARGWGDPQAERAGLGRDPLHNTFLEVALRSGLIGLAMFCGVFIVYWRVARCAMRSARSPYIRNTAIGLHGFIILTLISTCFAPLLQVPYVAIPFWLAVGLQFAIANVWSPVYRPRFLGHSSGRIRPDLWVATVGDRRS